MFYFLLQGVDAKQTAINGYPDAAELEQVGGEFSGFRGYNWLGTFSAVFNKGDNFYNFLFAFL